MRRGVKLWQLHQSTRLLKPPIINTTPIIHFYPAHFVQTNSAFCHFCEPTLWSPFTDLIMCPPKHICKCKLTVCELDAGTSGLSATWCCLCLQIRFGFGNLIKSYYCSNRVHVNSHMTSVESRQSGSGEKHWLAFSPLVSAIKYSRLSCSLLW